MCNLHFQTHGEPCDHAAGQDAPKPRTGKDQLGSFGMSNRTVTKPGSLYRGLSLLLPLAASFLWLPISALLCRSIREKSQARTQSLLVSSAGLITHYLIKSGFTEDWVVLVHKVKLHLGQPSPKGQSLGPGYLQASVCAYTHRCSHRSAQTYTHMHANILKRIPHRLTE